MTKKMNFPIIALKEGDNRVYVFSNEKVLKRTNTDLLNKDVFDNTVFIDCDGNRFNIIEVVKERWANIFGGYSPFWKGRQLYIDFRLESAGVIEFNDLKSIVTCKLKENPGSHFDELKHKIEKAASYNELFNLLS